MSDTTEHRMLPGSHERGGGAECVCGAEWSRWAGRCARQVTARPLPPGHPMTASPQPGNQDGQATHVVDRDGNVWAVVRDGGMATRADFGGIHSAGVAWLEAEAGPLLPFDPIAYRRNYPRADW